MRVIKYPCTLISSQLDVWLLWVVSLALLPFLLLVVRQQEAPVGDEKERREDVSLFPHFKPSHSLDLDYICLLKFPGFFSSGAPGRKGPFPLLPERHIAKASHWYHLVGTSSEDAGWTQSIECSASVSSLNDLE